MPQQTLLRGPDGLMYRSFIFDDGSESLDCIETDPLPELPVLFDARLDAEIFGELYHEVAGLAVEVIDRPLIVLVEGAPTRARVVHELREAR